MSTQTGTKELTEIIVKAIQDEPYFTKDVLIPKIRALIKAFRLDLSSCNYSKIEKPTDKERLIRSNELHNLEKEWWKDKIKDVVGNDKMQTLYNELNHERQKWGKI